MGTLNFRLKTRAEKVWLIFCHIFWFHNIFGNFPHRFLKKSPEYATELYFLLEVDGCWGDYGGTL